MKKMVVSDYDRTFYINDEDIEENKKAVKNFTNDGNLFVIATGRSFWDFKKKVDIYNICYDYAILNHGATIIDKDNNILSNIEIENRILADIKKEITLKEATNYFCCSKLESRVDFEHENLTKINIKYKTPEKALEINKLLNTKYKDFIHSYYIMNTSLEIISNKTSKSQAIEFLINKSNIDDKNVYAIGDGYSDIEMIKTFNGYCMENSVEELKKVAKGQYNSVSELIYEIM